jgi:DNA-binding CsgD family transcriptional regulator
MSWFCAQEPGAEVPDRGGLPSGLPSGLTARGAQVPVRLGQGRSNPEIAEPQVSRKTVSSHLEHIYAKLG